jgi:2-polyprenyl-6-methoxyphenol hydroxylase-like FAD-dependent oxidoreductase
VFWIEDPLIFQGILNDKKGRICFMSKKAMIIGAGIGGLCSAIALQKQGFQVKVFDKAKDFSTVGAGIVLAANALKVLEQLDLTGEVMSQGARVGKAEIRTWDGKLIVNLPTNEQAKRYGTHSYLIHRVYLQSILLNHIDLNTDIHLNKKLLTFKQTKSKVTAYFADGTEEEGDILIGADGIHSNVRKQLVGPENSVMLAIQRLEEFVILNMIYSY